MATGTQIQQNQGVHQDVIRQRMSFIIIVVVFVAIGLLLRVVSFQFPQDPRFVREFAAQRDANYGRIERVEAPRGNIYDRNGNPLAVNTRQYRVGISPNLISNPSVVAAQLASILNRDELEIYELITRPTTWVLLEPRVDPETWRQIDQLGLSFAITVDRIQRRVYPQETLASQVLGFVAGDGEDMRGYNGVEGHYNQQLAGRTRDTEVSNIPFDLPEDPALLGRGTDLVLTIDRDVQYLAEVELERAVVNSGATGGTIIVMNPRNGDILAMASYPTYNPNQYTEVDGDRLRNPAISDIFEPGSVFKVITVAAAIQNGTITPGWTYNDQGAFDIGGIRIQNWDRRAYGMVDTTQLLVDSLNVGAATVAQMMGWQDFYRMMRDFGMGRPTGVDMQAEEAGILRVPGSPNWSESDLGTNSFGQGISTTPLQMLTAVNAIANGGLMMQPRIVSQRIDGDVIYPANTIAIGRPISAETARAVTDMMVAVVRDGIDERAGVPGYTIAGKTGTAQRSTPLGTYDPNLFIMSFVGFLPADDPQVSVLVKIDNPTTARWASEIAAPVFSRMAARLVDLLEIPNDEVRRALAAEGVTSGERDR